MSTAAVVAAVPRDASDAGAAVDVGRHTKLAASRPVPVLDSSSTDRSEGFLPVLGKTLVKQHSRDTAWRLLVAKGTRPVKMPPRLRLRRT